ncbi:MAG TPA: hypothetical protein VFB19_08750 [Mycobacterium sp.]|nr:hypothetical protein [Mycobacterium sp.]
MLEMVHRVLSYRFSIAELIGIQFLVGFPYLLVGVLWSINHTDHLQEMHGVDKIVSFLGQIVSWPVLLFSDVCMT